VFLARHPWLKGILFRLGVISAQQYQAVWPNDIVWLDASKRLPFGSASVSKIYSSHFLEHLPYHKGLSMLHECRRLLKPSGVFRLVVPDLLYHAKKYINETEELIATDIASRETHDDFLRTLMGKYLSRARSAHCYMYDWPTLATLLPELGFKSVHRRRFQDSQDSELASLDNRPDDSLFVEMTV
jgi:SAM-dependent methyltransferase